MSAILLIVILVLLFGGVGGWGHANGYPWAGPGIGIGGVLVIILIVALLTGRL